MLTPTTVTRRTDTKYGTRSASYDPTGRVIVRRRRHPRATPLKSSTSPGSVGSGPSAAPGTAAGTPVAAKPTTVTIDTTEAGRRIPAPSSATTEPTTTAVTPAATIALSRWIGHQAVLASATRSQTASVPATRRSGDTRRRRAARAPDRGPACGVGRGARRSSMLMR